MALREILARFGFQVDQKGLKQAQGGIAGVVGSLRTFGAAIAGSFVIQGIKNFVTEIIDAGDALGKTSTQLGLTSKELQQWQLAANFAGVEATHLNQGFRILGKNALLAQQGSKQAKNAFDELGVSFEDSSGNLRRSNELARDAGIALGKLEDRTKAVGLAQQIFGRSGAALLPLFKDGAEGLDKMLAKLEEFGGGLSDDLIPLAEAAKDRMTEWEIATTSLKSRIAVAFLPILNRAVAGMSKFMAWISKTTKGTGIWKSLLTTLGITLTGVGIAKFGKQLIRLARAAALPLLKFVLLFLIVDDLIALFEGRGSVIGDFIDEVFGEGTAEDLVESIKDLGKAIKELAQSGDLEAFDKSLEKIFAPKGFDIASDISFAFDLAVEAVGKGINDIKVSLNLGWMAILMMFRAWVKKKMKTVQAAGVSVGIVLRTAFGTLITDHLLNVWEGQLNGAIDVFQGWVNQQLGQIKAAGNLIRPLMSQLGQDMMDGLIEAIQDGADAVFNSLKDVVKNAIGGARKTIRAKSPSQETGDKIGEPLIQGVVHRMQKMAHGASKMASAALYTASGIQRTSISRSASPALGGVGQVQPIFKSDISITVHGGSVSDPQIAKLRTGLRGELSENRRATLAALTQRVATS